MASRLVSPSSEIIDVAAAAIVIFNAYFAICTPKEPRSLSSSAVTNPSVYCILPCKSANAVPTVAMAPRLVSPSAEILDTAFAAILICLAYVLICSTKSPKSLDPVISCFSPPLGSIFFCKLANI